MNVEPITETIIEATIEPVCPKCKGTGYIKFWPLPECEGLTLYRWVKPEKEKCSCVS